MRDKLGSGDRKKADEAAGPPAPDLPDAVSHLWRWFGDIQMGEPPGFGPVGVSWPTLAAWCDLTGRALAPWEARAIVALGACYANVMSEEPVARKDQNSADRRLAEHHG